MLRFFEENNISLHLSDLSLIESTVSLKNKIELFDHTLLGKVLVINNEIQHIEAWQSLYHEPLVHIPASFVPNVTTALILGGGSFFAAQEILKYESIESVIMVDHDEDVIRTVQNNYLHVKSIMGSKRFRLVSNDAFNFLKGNSNKFDLIINDAIDLLDYRRETHEILASHLSPNGICSDVVYRNIFEKKRCRTTIAKLKRKYSCAFSLMSIPEYPGVLHLLSMWSKNPGVMQSAKTTCNRVQKSWIKKSCPCEIFDPAFISYYLHLPPYIKKWVGVII